MRMRIRNTTSTKADVLNLKRRAYHKGKYTLLSPNYDHGQASRPVKCIRKNDRRQSSSSSREDYHKEPSKTSGNAYYSRANFNNCDEDEVDLPTVERPYSKILSFQKQQRAVAEETERAEGVTSCRSRSRSLPKPEEKKSSQKITDSRREAKSCQLSNHSSVRENMSTGHGSKNLAFLREQLVGKMKIKDKGEGMFETWSERENRINQSRRLHKTESGYSAQLKSSERMTNFKMIAEEFPTPKTLSDFDITTFQNIPDELYEAEWELVEDLIKSENPGVQVTEDNVARFSNDLERQEEEIEFIYQNMYPEDRIYVLENLIENYTGSLIFSDDAIGNLL